MSKENREVLMKQIRDGTLPDDPINAPENNLERTSSFRQRMREHKERHRYDDPMEPRLIREDGVITGRTERATRSRISGDMPENVRTTSFACLKGVDVEQNFQDTKMERS